MTSPRETVLCQYHYDPLDRLTSHALTDTLERQRFYCKSRLATEIQGAMRYSIVQHGEQLLAQQRGEGDESETTVLSTDQQRSVLQALKANHPPQPIGYSPYGHRPVESGLLSLLGFNGERPDPVTRCYLLGNGYRAFNPVLMRFNSPDSLSPFHKGGLNAYGYCFGDPINLRDPNGHFPISAASNFMQGWLKRANKLATSSQAIKPVKYAQKFRSQITADLANAPSSSNAARSSLPIDQPVEHFNPAVQRSNSLNEVSLSMFERRNSGSPTPSRASINSDPFTSVPAASGRHPSADSISPQHPDPHFRPTDEFRPESARHFDTPSSTNADLLIALEALAAWKHHSPSFRVKINKQINFIRGRRASDLNEWKLSMEASG